MAQFVTRLDDDLVRAIDELVEHGVMESRSDAVRRGLQILVDNFRRQRIADDIVAGYQRLPQTDAEMGWADASTVALIGEEPW
jgi:Arc/MetJ-type ribon-helix-helix transcriptional regulator